MFVITAFNRNGTSHSPRARMEDFIYKRVWRKAIGQLIHVESTVQEKTSTNLIGQKKSSCLMSDNSYLSPLLGLCFSPISRLKQGLCFISSAWLMSDNSYFTCQIQNAQLHCSNFQQNQLVPLQQNSNMLWDTSQLQRPTSLLMHCSIYLLEGSSSSFCFYYFGLFIHSCTTHVFLNI